MRDSTAKLRPFLRPNLDLLFVGLNPPEQSNANGHYFSGERSRFFDLLYRSGLISTAVAKGHADEIVFGGTAVNYQQREYGVVDLAPNFVMTNSSKVRTNRHHVAALLQDIRIHLPGMVCILHGKVANALRRYGSLTGPLDYGICGKVIPDCDAIVALNYFPNGNPIPDVCKLEIFGKIKDLL